MANVQKVSVHGGHSGQFCHHAKDSLEEVVKEYIRQGFAWVGITEHAPGSSPALLYPDQRAAGLTPEFLYNRFACYIAECRRLQEKYRNDIKIFTAMETETYSGYETFIPALVKAFSPDYLVGSVHFVNDLGFDYSAEHYMLAARAAGGLDALYRAYFDQQYEMIQRLNPSVVGHFDLIRIYDPDYQRRLQKKDIWQQIIRNLELIYERGSILDFNLRALAKGAAEPYVSSPVLKAASEMGIKVVPGDDSHGVKDVGNYYDHGIALLKQYNFELHCWPSPR